jgi:histidinol-phosphate aminotransferase
MTPFPESHVNPLLADIERTPDREPYPAEWIRLDLNEHVRALAPAVVEAIRARVTSETLSHYPNPWHFCERLAARLGVAVESLLLVPGSDAGIKSLCHVFVTPGDRVAMIEPSYAMYPVYTRMFGGVPAPVPVRDDLSTDLDGLHAACRGAKLLLLANPNQPSGGLLSEDEVLGLVREGARTGTIVVVDEAYYPFSRTTLLPRVTEHPNLLVVRTFSKAYGLAGVRLGFIAGRPSLVRALKTVRPNFEINSFVTLCAQYLLEHPELVDAFLPAVRESAQILQAVARRFGLPAPPAHANFQLLKVGPRFDPKQLSERLKERGWVIKGPFPEEVMRDWVRITLGDPDLIAAFAERLAAVLTSMDRAAAAAGVAR